MISKCTCRAGKALKHQIHSNFFMVNPSTSKEVVLADWQLTILTDLHERVGGKSLTKKALARAVKETGLYVDDNLRDEACSSVLSGILIPSSQRAKMD